jgi:hypothetical protein
MKLKLDADGHVVVQDGKPVYVYDDGKEVAFDAPATAAKITQLNSEAKGHRERAEAAEKGLKAFEGIEDAAAARKALETIKNLDQKKLVDAGEIEKVKSEAIKAVEDKYAPLLAERDKLQSELYGEKVGGSFARSKLIADKLAIPSDLVQAKFGGAFKVEDGKVVAYGQDGNKIFSRERPGEVANFDEALEFLIDQYPHRDSILKGSGATGTGSKGAGAGGAGGSKTLNRAAFEALSPADQQAHFKGGGKLTD